MNAQGRDRAISDVQEMYVWKAARRESRQIVHRTQGYVFFVTTHIIISLGPVRDGTKVC
jgi:hypothetical protein